MERLNELGSSRMNKFAIDYLRILIIVFWIFISYKEFRDSLIAFVFISILVWMIIIALTFLKKYFNKYLVDSIFLDGDYIIIERKKIQEKILLSEIVDVRNSLGGLGGSNRSMISIYFNKTINSGNKIEFFAKRRYKKQVGSLLNDEIERVKYSTINLSNF